MTPPTSVSEYYAGKSIFITGATGFLGKVLVEKLLRCCPDLKKIYMLMRPKKGQSSKERLEDFVNSRVFDRIHREYSKRLDKLQLVPGDVLAEDLGISIKDREQLERECQILYHCAACVRFDLPLKEALNLNTGGTQKVLKLAEGMSLLEIFVHVSTSYCRCELPVLEEKVYPFKHRPQHLMDIVSWMDDQLLQHLESKIIEPQPNTYAYTKSLTEDLVAQYSGKFPIVIARPSIVTAAYKEPYPGWVDNLNGPTGLLVGAGKGVIRTMHCNENYNADVVPVDMIVNACILLSYKHGMTRPKELQVCNLTLSEENPLTWGQALDMGRLHVNEFPFSVSLWYPGGSIKSSRLQHQVAAFFTHLLPAYFVDMILKLTGNKTFMVKIQKRVTYGLEVLQYYTTKQWHFRNDNYVALRQGLSEQDDNTFYTDLKSIDWSLYVRDYMKGAREFVCKEDPATLPKARRMLKQLYYLDKTLQFIIYAICAYLVYYYLKMFLSAIN